MHGQCGTTATMIAASMRLKNCVLVHTQAVMAGLENSLNPQRNKIDEIYSKLGMNNLCYELKSHELTQEDVMKNVSVLVDDSDGAISNLYLLPSSARVNTDDERELILAHIVTKDLPKFFDYVCVDLGAGEITPMKKAIMNDADKNFLVVSQSKQTLDKNYENVKNLGVIIGTYDPARKITPNTIRKMFKTNTVYTVPYCGEYADALSEGKTIRFFLSNEKLMDISMRKYRKDDPLCVFFKNLPDLEKAT